MMLYTKSGSIPAPIPHRIRLADGFTRTDPAQFTAEDIASAGYVEAPPMPEHDPATQRVEWTGDGWAVVDLPVTVSEPVIYANGT